MFAHTYVWLLHSTKRKGNVRVYKIGAWMIIEALFVVTLNWGKKLKAQMPINRCMDKHIVGYPNLGILLSNKNKWTTDTCNIVDKSQKKIF